MHELSLTDLTAAQWAISPDSLEATIATVERSLTALSGRQGMGIPAPSGAEIRGSTAVIAVRGPIFRYSNIVSLVLGWSTIEDLTEALNSSIANPKVDRIVLEIDSPGGMVAGVSEFAQAVKGADKTTVAYISGIGASAAYWIAAAANEVMIGDTGSAGSIGVVGTYHKRPNGQTEIVSSQSPRKRPDVDTDEGRSILQEHVDSLASVFVNAVSAYRKVQPEKVISDFGAGGLLVGQLAVNAGLADRLGSLNTAIKSKSTVREVVNMNVAKMEAHVRSSGLDPMEVEQFVAAQWQSNRELRAEFRTIETATSYFQAMSRGSVGRVAGVIENGV